MLKFIKHHLTSIIGIEVYPMIAFVIFFSFFLGMLWYVLTTRKKRIQYMERMPLIDTMESGDQQHENLLYHVQALEHSGST